MQMQKETKPVSANQIAVIFFKYCECTHYTQPDDDLTHNDLVGKPENFQEFLRMRAAS